MAYTDQSALANDATFRGRVRVAVATAAKDVMGEAVGSYSTDQFGKRQRLALEVIRAAAAGELLDAFTWLTVTNAAITTASTDMDIQFTVNSLFDDLHDHNAGVKVTD